MTEPITYKPLSSISASEQVSELAIWQLIRKGIINSRILHGTVVVSIEEWNDYAESPIGKRYLKERRELGRDYYAEMAKQNGVENLKQ